MKKLTRVCCDYGQCADVEFFITPRSLDTDAITQKFIEKVVEEVLAPLISVLGVGASLIPGVGEAIAAGAAFAAAGLDLANMGTEIGLDVEPNDQFLHAINGSTVTWNSASDISVTTAVGC